MQLNSENNAHCLWHDDKNPSLHFYKDHAYCFSCKKNADAIELVQKAAGCSFQDALFFLDENSYPTCLNNSYMNHSFTSEQKIKENSNEKIFEECMQNEHFFTRISCLQVIYEILNLSTQEKIKRRLVPTCIASWLKDRGYNLNELLTDFSNRNILFVEDAEALSTQVREKIKDWEKSALFNDGGRLKWFSENKYAIAFPVFNVFKTNYGSSETIITSMRLRNISLTTQKDDQKEVEMPGHEAIKGKIPSSFGFVGLEYWSQKYQQVFDKCQDLTVVLTEGSADFLAGCLLFKNEVRTIVLTAGTLAKNSQKHNLMLIKNCHKLILAFDNDAAGKIATEKTAEKAYEIGIKEVEFFPVDCSHGKDLNDILKTLKKRNNTI